MRKGLVRSSERNEALVGALLIAVFGFGAMSVFAIVAGSAPGLRGFWSYRSATLGDAFLLPLMTFALLRIAPLKSRLSLAALAFAASVAVAAVSVGTWLNVTALLAEGAELNWTHPAPHRFNAPGWYHSTFLILASSVIACLFAAAVAVASTASRRPGDSTPGDGVVSREPDAMHGWFDVVTFAVVGFACLLARDNFPPGTGVQFKHLAAPIAAALVMATAGLVVSSPGQRRGAIVRTLAASLVGTLLCGALWDGWAGLRSDTWVILIAALGSAAAAVFVVQYHGGVQRGVGRHGRIARDMFVGFVIVFGPLAMVANSGNSSLLAWTASVLVVVAGSRLHVASIIRREGRDAEWPSNRIANLAALFVVVSAAAVWWKGTGAAPDSPVPQVVFALLALASSGLVPQIVRDLIAIVEKREGLSDEASALVRAKLRAYGTFVALLFTGLATLWAVVLAGGGGLILQSNGGAPVAGWWCVGVFLGGAAVTWVLRNHRTGEVVATSFLLADAFALGLLVAHLDLSAWGLADWYALWPAVVVGAFVGVSAFGQGNRLTRDPRTVSHRVGVALAGIVGFSVVAILPVLSNLPESTSISRVLQTVGLWISGIVVAPLVATVAYATAHSRRTPLASGTRGFAGPIQDVVLAFLLGALALYLPLVLIAAASDTAVLTIAGVLVFWGGWGGWLPLTFNKRYLDERVRELRDKGASYPPDLHALESHMRKQNLVAAGVLAPLLVLGLFSIFWSGKHAPTMAVVRAKVSEGIPRLPANFTQTP